MNSYDGVVPWGETAEEWWKFYGTRDWLAGGFAWTGFDYRGEPTPYGWPSINSQFGIVDMCGFPKDIFYYYKAWWGKEPSLHLFPHWNFEGREGDEIPVWVYTNLEEVELFVNGKSLGSQKVPHLGHVEWKVKYEPGSIEARGSKGGKVVLTEKRETTGPAVAIRLTADRTEINADGEDVAVLKVEGLDKEGRARSHRRQSHRVQGLRSRRTDRRRQRRSQLPGERQGAEAFALQRPCAGDRAIDEAARRNPHRSGQGRLGRSRADSGQARHHDQARRVATVGSGDRDRKVDARPQTYRAPSLRLRSSAKGGRRTTARSTPASFARNSNSSTSSYPHGISIPSIVAPALSRASTDSGVRLSFQYESTHAFTASARRRASLSIRARSPARRARSAASPSPATSRHAAACSAVLSRARSQYPSPSRKSALALDAQIQQAPHAFGVAIACELGQQRSSLRHKILHKVRLLRCQCRANRRIVRRCARRDQSIHSLQLPGRCLVSASRRSTSPRPASRRDRSCRPAVVMFFTAGSPP